MQVINGKVILELTPDQYIYLRTQVSVAVSLCEMVTNGTAVDLTDLKQLAYLVKHPRTAVEVFVELGMPEELLGDAKEILHQIDTGTL